MSFPVVLFHVSSLVICSNFMSISSLVLELWQISFVRDWIDHKSGNRKHSCLSFLLNIWRLGQVRDIKFDINVFNKMLLNAAKFQGCNFYHFWVINGKPTERETAKGGGRGTDIFKWKSFGFVCDALLSLYLIKIPNLFYYFLSKTYGNPV